MREEYFVTFDGSREQFFRAEWNSSPKITIDIAGPLVLGTFTNVPWRLPATVMYLMKASEVEKELSPPNASSTYEPKTA